MEALFMGWNFSCDDQTQIIQVKHANKRRIK